MAIAWWVLGRCDVCEIGQPLSGTVCAYLTEMSTRCATGAHGRRPPDVFGRSRAAVVMRVVAGGAGPLLRRRRRTRNQTGINFNEKDSKLDFGEGEKLYASEVWPNTEYEVNVLSVNDVGEVPRPAPTRFKTLPSIGEIASPGAQGGRRRRRSGGRRRRRRRTGGQAREVGATTEPAVPRSRTTPGSSTTRLRAWARFWYRAGSSAATAANPVVLAGRSGHPSGSSPMAFRLPTVTARSTSRRPFVHIVGAVLEGSPSACADATDANDDGFVNIAGTEMSTSRIS